MLDMRKSTYGVELSASDLANHLGCRHLTNLDLAAAEGRLVPPIWHDPAWEVLQERGLELEHFYLICALRGWRSRSRKGMRAVHQSSVPLWQCAMAPM